MRLDSVRIPGDPVPLAALRYVPEQPPRPQRLIYTHGFTSGKYSFDGLASYLAAKRYVGLTFDCVGHKLGATGGEMRHIVQAAENLRDALAWERAQTPESDIILIGHSMGAAATLQVAAWEQENPNLVGRLAGIVCLCMGTNPSQAFSGPLGKTMLAQRQDYVMGAPAPELLSQLDAMALTVRAIGTLPALFVAAKQDVLLPVERVEALAALAGAHADFRVIESSHLEAPDRSRGTILQWLESEKDPLRRQS